MKTLQDLIEKQKALKAEFVTKATAGFKDALKEIFTEVPELLALKWNQYTPYFNDGEACEFRVGDMYFKLSTTPADAGDYEDGFESVWSMNYKKTAPHPATAALETFSKLIRGSEMEDILYSMFDDHKEIVCTRDGNVEVSDYEHD